MMGFELHKDQMSNSVEQQIGEWYLKQGAQTLVQYMKQRMKASTVGGGRILR